MIEIDCLPVGSHGGLDKLISQLVSQGELRHEEGAELLPGLPGEIVVERRHMDQQCCRCNPVIVGIEMAGMFASAVQFAEQTSDFFKHGSPTQCAPQFEMSLESHPPANLWPCLHASDKRLGCDLLDRFAPFSAFIEQNKVVFNAGGPGGFAPSRAASRIPSQNEGVALIVKNR
jgi:hypothetical protein